MSAIIIDGKAVALQIRGSLRSRVDALKATGITPGLSVVLVGDDAASRVYVQHKVRACEELGIASSVVELPADTTQAALAAAIAQLNADAKVHGILVQLPLPPQIDVRVVLAAVALDKDVDGFHLQHMGGLMVGDCPLPPCTPAGAMELLKHYDIPLAGRNAVVIGRSNIVGKPMAMMLLAKDATVSICTSKTKNMTDYTKLADVLVVAAGKPNLVTGAMIKPGAAVIDVGINRLPDGKLVGDVDFASARLVAGHITPVPGGVGPMTIAMLLVNTLNAAQRLTRKTA